MKKLLTVFSILLILMGNAYAQDGPQVPAFDRNALIAEMQEMQRLIEELNKANHDLNETVKSLETMQSRNGRGWGIAYQTPLMMRCNDTPILQKELELRQYVPIAITEVKSAASVLAIEELYANPKTRSMAIVIWYPTLTGCVAYRTEANLRLLPMGKRIFGDPKEKS